MKREISSVEAVIRELTYRVLARAQTSPSEQEETKMFSRSMKCERME